MGIGFIQDKLEIKFLILYIAARVTEPLTPEDMQDLTMCDDGIDYFDYAECLNDLVKTEHLRLTEEVRHHRQGHEEQPDLRVQPAAVRAAAVRQKHRGL